MPHKRNPVLIENVCGPGPAAPGPRCPRARERGPLARAGHLPLLGGAGHHAGRNILLDFMMHRLKGVLANLVVHPETCGRTSSPAGGWCSPRGCSWPWSNKGLTRDGAYRLTQRAAMQVWEEGGTFKERVLADPGDRQIFIHRRTGGTLRPQAPPAPRGRAVPKGVCV